jgi:hypothetical protein
MALSSVSVIAARLRRAKIQKGSRLCGRTAAAF